MDVEKLILGYIAHSGEVRSAEIVKSTGYSRAYVNRFFKKLVEEGKIKLVGKANQAKYVAAELSVHDGPGAEIAGAPTMQPAVFTPVPTTSDQNITLQSEQPQTQAAEAVTDTPAASQPVIITPPGPVTDAAPEKVEVRVTSKAPESAEPEIASIAEPAVALPKPQLLSVSQPAVAPAPDRSFPGLDIALQPQAEEAEETKEEKSRLSRWLVPILSLLIFFFLLGGVYYILDSKANRLARQNEADQNLTQVQINQIHNNADIKTLKVQELSSTNIAGQNATFQNLSVTSLLSCDSIDTNESGVLVCGTDGGDGAAAVPLDNLALLDANNIFTGSVNTFNGLQSTSLTSCDTIDTDTQGNLICGSDSTGISTSTLQLAYDAGNTIVTTTGRDIEITLDDVATDTTFEITQVGTADIFRVNDDGTFTDATPFVIDQSGSVGIGTASPGTTLDVFGDSGVRLSRADDDSVLILRRLDGTPTVGDRISSIESNGPDTLGNETVYSAIRTISTGITDGSEQGALTFSTLNGGVNPQERVRIDYLGNVGIGTTAPASLLAVSGGASIGSGYTSTAAPINGLIVEGNVGIGTSAPTAGYKLHVYNATPGAGSVVRIQDADDLAAGAVLTAGSVNADLVAVGSTGTGTSLVTLPNSAYFRSGSTASNGLILVASNAGAPIIFGTGGSASANERVRIDSAGNVGIGDITPSYLLTVGSGDLFGINSSGNVIVTALGSAGSTAVCRNGSNQLSTCSGSGGTDPSATLQAAYDNSSSPATITTADGKNIRIALQDTATDQSLEISQAGTAVAFRVNDDGTFSDSSPFVIDQSGNVGIGTASPTELVDILNGNILVKNNQGGIKFESGGGVVNRFSLTANTDGHANFGFTNNGLSDSRFDLSAYDYRFQVNSPGVDALFIENTGEVGIGTTTPGALLHVGNTTGDTFGGTTRAILSRDSISSIGGLQLTIEGDTDRGIVFGESAVGTWVQRAFIYNDHSNSSLDFGLTGSTSIMTLRGSNVGIGDTTPDSKLHLTSNGSNAALAHIRLESTVDSSFFTVSNDSNRFIIRDGSDNNLFNILGSNGNVGIGDDSPAALFTVGSGDLFQVNSSGDITTASGNDLGITAGGVGDIVVTTDADTTVVLNGLTAASGTSLCIDGSNNVVTCAVGSSSATLQSAYNNGNTIDTTDSRNIVFNLANTTTDADFLVNIQGTGNAFEVQDSGTAVFSVIDGGGATFRNSIDSTSGFQIQDADGGTPIFVVDTDNEKIGLGVNGAGIDSEVGRLAVSYTATGTSNQRVSEFVMINNTTAGFQGVLDVANSVGTGTTEYLLSVSNNDTDSLTSDGIWIHSSTGGITDAIDASDSEIVNAINVGANNILGTTAIIDFTNFDLDASGVITNATWQGTTVAVGFGGTGATTFTTNGVLYGNAASAIGVTAAGTTGQCLVATTGSAPTWGTCAGSGSGVTLQAAYDNGNTIVTTTGRDIEITLDDVATDTTFEITQVGTADIFRVNDDGTFTDATPFVIDQSGSVGIGLTTPAALLDVNGVIQGRSYAGFGGNVNNANMTLYASRSFTGGVGSAAAGIRSDGTITGAVDTNIQGGYFTNAFAEAASGTHPVIAQLMLDAPTVTNGGGATGILSTLYINGAPTGVTPSSGPYAIFVDDGDSRFDGAVGIGTTPTSKLHVTESTTSTSTYIGSNFSFTSTPSANKSAADTGINSLLTIAGANQAGNARALNAQLNWTNTNTSSAGVGLNARFETSGSAAASSLSAAALLMDHSGTGAVTNAYGLRLNDLVNAGTLTNTYGIYLGDVTTGTQTNQAYGLYQADTGARNYFGGNVGIGDTSPSALLTVGSGDLFQINSSGDITTAAGENLAVTAGGSGDVVFNTDSDTTVQLVGLGTATGSALCIDGSNNIVTCGTGSSSATLQSAYGADVDGGDTIIELTTADDSLIFRNPAASGSDSEYVLTIDQLATGASNGGLLIMNSGGASSYSFRVNDDGTSTDSTPFMVDSAGNVGIGTTSARSILDLGVDGSILTIGGASTGGRIYFGTNTGRNSIRYNNNEFGIFTDQSNGVRFFTNTDVDTATPEVVITDGGKVGIGLSSPDGKLHVISTGSGATTNVLTVGNAATANNTGARIGFNLSTTDTSYQAFLDAVRTNSGSAQATYLSFGTHDGTSLAERWRVTEAGLLQASAAGNYGAANTTTYLCRNSSNQIATCNTTGSGVAFVQGGNSFNETAVLGTNDAFDLQFETAGTTRLTLDQSGNATLTGNMRVSDGAVGAPSYSFTNDTNTGLYSTASGAFSISLDGIQRVDFGGGTTNAAATFLSDLSTQRGINVRRTTSSTTNNLIEFQNESGGSLGAVTGAGTFRSAIGSASSVAYGFTGEGNTGFFRPSAGQIAFSSAGTQVWTLANAALTTQVDNTQIRPTAQGSGSGFNFTLKSGDVTTATDAGAGTLNIQGGVGTGAGTGGTIVFGTPTTLATGTTAQTVSTRLTVGQGDVTTNNFRVTLASGGQISAPVGSASLPAYSFTGDLTTGFFQSTTGQINVTNSGTQTWNLASQVISANQNNSAIRPAPQTSGSGFNFTTKAGDVTTAANAAGGTLNIQGGLGTGTGAGGTIVFGTPNTQASGTTAQTNGARLTIGQGDASNNFSITVASGGTLVSPLVNATTGFRYNGTAPSGEYLRGDGTNFVSSALLAGDISGTLFTLDGDDADTEAIVSGNTLLIAGGTNGIDTDVSASDTVTLNLDTTEIGTTTFGSGSDFTWTFDGSGSNPTIAFGSGDINVTPAAATDIFNILTGNLKIGDASPNVSLDGDDAFIEGTLEVDGTVRFEDTVTLNNLGAAGSTALCRNGSNIIGACSGSGGTDPNVTLQNAYANGNTITTTTGRDIEITLADVATDTTLEITQAGTADILRVNDDGTFSDTSPFVIDQSGNVGIGDPSPSGKLDIAGNVNIDTSGVLSFNGGTGINVLDLNNNKIFDVDQLVIGDTGQQEGITFENGATDQHISVYTAAQGGFDGFVFDSASSFPFIFQNSNVGIGDTTPAAALTVGDGDDFQVSSTGQVLFNGVATDITTTSGEHLTLLAAGAGEIVLDDTVQVTTLGAASNDTVVCRNGSNQLATCNSTFAAQSYVTLQNAYANGNTIDTTDADNSITFNLANTTDDEDFIVNIQGTGNTFEVQDGGTAFFTLADARVGTYAGSNDGTFTFTSDLSSAARSSDLVTISQANNITNDSTGNLLQLTNSDGGSTASVLRIDNAANGVAIDVLGTTSTGTGIQLIGLTNGINIGASAGGTGYGVSIAGFSNASTSSAGLRIDGTASTITADYTGALINVIPTRTLTSAATRTDSGQHLNVVRGSTVNNASATYNISGHLANLQGAYTATSGTLNITGDILNLSSNCTGAGTCTDTSNILELNQQYASASGTVLNIIGAGTGNLATLDASNTSANGVSIDVQSSSSSQYVMSLTANNGATNVLYARADGNVGIGTTSPDVKLNIVGGTDASVSNGSGYLVLGAVSGTNLVVDDNEIIARNNGAASNLLLQEPGGSVGIGTSGPDRKLDVLDTSNPQLRLTQADGTAFTDFQTDSSGNLTINNSGTFSAFSDDLQVNGGDIGISSDTDLLQLASSALTVNGTIAVTTLGTTGTTGLCRNASNLISTCNGANGTDPNVTLQNAYANGNTIDTTDARDIDIDLADTTTDSDFTIDIQGTGNTFEIQDGGTAFFTLADGGTVTHAYTGNGTAHTINANSLTTGKALELTNSNAAQTTSTLLSVVQSGVTTGYTGNLVDITGTSTTGTGNLVKITTANTTNGAGLSLTANGLTTGFGVDLQHATSSITTGALMRVQSTVADGYTTGGLVNIINNTAFTSTANTAGLLDVESSGTTTGTLVNIAASSSSQTTARALNVVQSGVTTGYTGNFVNFTGSSTTGAGNLINVTSVNTTAGNALNVTANALTSGDAVDINHTTSAITSGSLLRVSSTAADAFSTGGLAVISSSGNFTSTANTAGLLRVSSTASAAGTLVNIDNSFASQTTSTLLNVVQSGVTTGYTGNVANITGSSTTGAANVLNISSANSSAGNALNVTANSLSDGDAVDINSTSNSYATGELLKISLTQSAATGTSVSGNIAQLSFNPTYSTAVTTPAISGNLLNVSRAATTNSSFASTLTVSGDVANLSSNCTQTTGTCTDTSNVLELNQQYSGASGAVLNILNSGSGADILTSDTGFTLDISNASDSTFTVTNTAAGVASLSVEGDVAVGSGRVYKVGATSGATITCSATTFLRAQNTLGGIVTSGTCANGDDSLQSAYDNGNTVDTTDNRNVVFNLADTTTDSDFIVNIQGTGNTFEVQDAGSAVLTVVDGGNVTLAADLAVNGGDLTTTQTTFNLLNATATTINFGAAATDVNLGVTGSTAGTFDIFGGSGDTGCTFQGSNGNLTCSGDLAVNGGDITTTSTTLNIDVANTGDIFFRDGTNNFLQISDEGSDADFTFKGDLLPATDNTYDLGSTSLRWKTLHTGPGSVVVHNDATNTDKITLGYSGATAQLDVDTATTFNLINDTATTINMGGATTALNLGSTGSALTFTFGNDATFPLLNTKDLTFTSSLASGARSTDLITISQANDATNNNTANLLEINNADTGSTGTLVNIVQGSTAAAAALSISTSSTTNAIAVTTPSSGVGIQITGGGAGGNGVTVNGYQTGTSFGVNDITNGTGYYVFSAPITGGNAINLGGSQSGTLTGFTGNYLSINPLRTHTAASSITDTGNFIDVQRANTINNASGTYNITGDLVSLQSNCTVTAGTCTDSSSILVLDQNYASASGSVLSIKSEGTGDFINVVDETGTDSTVFKLMDTGQTLFKNSTNSTAAFKIQSSEGSNVLWADTTTSTYTDTDVTPSYAGGMDADGATNTGTTSGPGINSVFVSGSHTYLGKATSSGTCSGSTITGCEFAIASVSTPGAPAGLAGIDIKNDGSTDVAVNSVYVVGNYAYVATAQRTGTCSGSTFTGCEFFIVDITTPGSPSLVSGSGVDRTVGATDVFVSGSYAYLGNTATSGTCSGSTFTGCEFLIIDVSTPSAVALVSGSGLNVQNGTPSDVTVNTVQKDGNYAYIGTADRTGTCTSGTTHTGCELIIVDVSTPGSPSITGGIDLPTGGVLDTKVISAQAQLFIVKGGSSSTCSTSPETGCEFQSYDISTPSSPSLWDYADSDGTLYDGINGATYDSLFISGDYAYIGKTASGSACGSADGRSGGCELHVYKVLRDDGGLDWTFVGGIDGSALYGDGNGNGTTVNDLFVSGNYLYTARSLSSATCSNIPGGNGSGTPMGCELQTFSVAATGNTYPSISISTFAGGYNISVLSRPGAPTVTKVSCSGSTTWGYKVTALSATGETLASEEGQATSACATLNSSNYVTVSWSEVKGAVGYNVYRVTTTSATSPTTKGLILVGMAVTSTSINDQGSDIYRNHAGQAVFAGLSTMNDLSNAIAIGLNGRAGDGSMSNVFDHLDVNGRINSRWHSFYEEFWGDMTTVSHTATTTANAVYGPNLRAHSQKGTGGNCTYSQSAYWFTISVTQATTGTNSCRIGFGSQNIITDENPVIEVRVDGGIGTDGASNAAVGFHNTTSAISTYTASDGVYFMDTGIGTWQVSNPNSNTFIDTGISVDDPHILRVEHGHDPATDVSYVKYFIDGELVYSSDLGTWDELLDPLINITTGTTGGTRTLELDYIKVWVDDPPAGKATVLSSSVAEPTEYSNVSNADLAENYPTDDMSISSGDVVQLDSSKVGYITKASAPYGTGLLGVISTQPGLTLGESNSITKPVALTGRVPVKISPNSPAIAPGDYLTASAEPGLAMKATQQGWVIGKALEAWDSASGRETILMFVNPTWNGSVADGLQSAGSGLQNGPMTINTMTTQDDLAQFAVGTADPLNKGIVVQGVEGQTADLFQAQAYDGTVLMSVSANGDVMAQGITVQKDLKVIGSASFVDIKVDGHVITGGGQIAYVLGQSIGAENVTVTVEGNDTTGALTINMPDFGATPPAEINLHFDFAKSYTSKPRVLLTPNNADAGAVQYWVTTEVDGFKLHLNNPVGNKPYQFFYWTAQ